MPALHRKIRPTYAVAALAGFAIVAIMVCTSFWLWDLRQRALAHASLEAVSVTRMFVEASEQNFRSTDVLLKSVQERMQSAYGQRLPLDSPQVHLLLNTRVIGVRHLKSLFIVDAQGQAVNSSADVASKQPLSVADRTYFKTLRDAPDDRLVIDRPVRSRIDQLWTLHLARKLTSPDGKLRGIIVAAVNTPYLEEFYALLKLDYARPVALYLDDGSLVASQPARTDQIGKPDADIARTARAASGPGIHFGQRTLPDGRIEHFTLSRVPDFPFLLSVTDEKCEALASWREAAIPFALGAFLVILFIATVAAYLRYELLREGRLARALGEANERYHQTVDSVMDAIIAIDDAQRILLFNPAAERMFGRTAQQVIGQPLDLLIPARLHAPHRTHVAHFATAEGGARSMAAHLEIMGLRADGSEFPIESTISRTLIGGATQLTAVLRDVTERRRAERELREMNEQLRGLSASLQNVREQERYRIAHELHDELGQQLTGLKLDLSWLSLRTKDGRAVAADKVDQMRQMLDTAIASVRRISTELRPLILDDLGFGEAVAWQVREFSRRTGIAVDVHLPAQALITDSDLATALYRIVQESLTNIARHAQASAARIELAEQTGALVLRIHDNGQGIDRSAPATGFGLVSMRERANALGGSFHIEGTRDTGTQIEVTLPLPDASAQEPMT